MRVAVIGVGHLGRQHARIWSRHPGVRLTAVCDVVAERAQEAAAATGACAVADYREAIAQADLVSIATPTRTHAPIASEAIRRGVAAIVEKPLAKTLPEAERIAREAEERGVVLAVGHVERFNPVVAAARERIGRVRFAECHRLSPFPRRSADIDVVLDLMIHDIDILLHLVEAPLARVNAVGISLLFPHEDLAHARLEFADGAVANVTASRVSAQSLRKIRLFGDAAYVSMDLGVREAAVYRPSPALKDALARLPRTDDPPQDVLASLPEKFYDVEFLRFDEGEPLAAELDDVFCAVRDGRPPTVPAAHGVRAMRVAEQVLRSIRAHRWTP